MNLPASEKREGIAEKKNGPESLLSHFIKVGAAGRNRTHDPLVRSQVLYPAELQPPEARIIAALDDLANPPIR
jgi:hypothetical protein